MNDLFSSDFYFATRLKITRYVSSQTGGTSDFQRKGYFVINTIGLAVAHRLRIYLYFSGKEWQTNTYHENIDHLPDHGSNRREIPTGGRGLQLAGRIAKAELPEVADYTRIITAREMKIRWENDDHYQTGISCGYADRQLFSMFTFPLVTGVFKPSNTPAGW